MGNTVSESAERECKLVQDKDIKVVAGRKEDYLELLAKSPILKKFGLIEEWKKDLDQPNIPNDLEDDIRVVCGKIAELAWSAAGRSHLLVNALAHRLQRRRM